MEKNRCPECKNILYSIDGLYYDKDGIRPAKYCAECYKLFESHAFGLVEKKHKTWVSKRIAELEAERDRLKADNETLLNHATNMAKELGKERDNTLRCRARLERLLAAIKRISGSGPINDDGEYDPYAAWSWCYDIAHEALKKAEEE